MSDEATYSNSPVLADLGAGARLAAGVRLGPYEILDLVGTGGAGRVYRARDTRLRREAAIKVLRAREGMAEGSLLAEAQAMAKVSHPGVVTVYDVGTTPSGGVYVAMEYVDGQTVRGWLSAAPRRWREVLAVFLSAGRGLAAAHAGGVVHRDFKPDNVLVGNDGRVRVADFGLAGLPLVEEAPVNAGIEPAACGTPAYMAPEQHLRQPVDARADQFSFCVSLHEGLFGRRPFAGTTLAEIRRNVLAGIVEAPPSRMSIPSRIRVALSRGLSRDPEARFADMEGLLAALEDDPWSRRRRALLIAALAASSALAVFGMVRRPALERETCDGGRARLAAAWGPDLRAALARAFLASGRPYAPDTFARVAAAFDAYAASWSAMHRDACEATTIRHEQSAALLDLRMACLEQRLGTFAALAALLGRAPDAAVVDRAALAASQLDDLARCADAAALSAAVPPPDEPSLRARALALQSRIDAAWALDQVGRYAEGRRLLGTIPDEAVALDYPPLTTRALTVAGHLARSDGDGAHAEKLVRAALQAAARAHDDHAAAALWGNLLYAIGYQQRRVPEALALVPIAEAALARAGDPPVVTAHVLTTIAAVLTQAGRHAEAEAHDHRAIALLEDRPEEREALARAFNNLGTTLEWQGKVDEAAAAFERSLEIFGAFYGPEHIVIASVLNGLGNLQKRQNKLEAAAATFERALAICRRTLGEEHPNCPRLMNNLGLVYKRQGRTADALRITRLALAIREAKLGPEHGETASALLNVAALENERGRHQEAFALAERALAIRQRLLGPDNPRTGEALAILGEIELARGRHREAAALFERALPLGVDEDPVETARTKVLLARALGRGARARALAGEARITFVAAGERARADVDEIDAWLKSSKR